MTIPYRAAQTANRAISAKVVGRSADGDTERQMTWLECRQTAIWHSGRALVWIKCDLTIGATPREPYVMRHRRHFGEKGQLMSYEGWIVVCLLGIILAGIVMAYHKQSLAVAERKSKTASTDGSGT